MTEEELDEMLKCKKIDNVNMIKMENQSRYLDNDSITREAGSKYSLNMTSTQLIQLPEVDPDICTEERHFS